MEGFASPNAEVVVLKDGKEFKKGKADPAAKFKFDISTGLAEGNYTFGLLANDTEGRRSRTYSTTFWIKVATKTTLTAIIIPPTITVAKVDLKPGEILAASGQTVPRSTIEIRLEPARAGASAKDIVTKTTTVGADGRWSISVETKSLAKGIYNLKARVQVDKLGYSDYSQTISVGLGEETAKALCEGSDLNHDGKVNLIDFSILLFYWNSNNACADQNHDGKVNLTDFSILLYNWTG